MYLLMKSLGMKSIVRRELPAATTAFVVAEFFYKFHSFALETLAFLATWWVLSWAASFIASAFARKDAGDGHQGA
jgi:hypothetical protein